MPNKCIPVITNKEKRYKVIELIHSEKKMVELYKIIADQISSRESQKFKSNF